MTPHTPHTSTHIRSRQCVHTHTCTPQSWADRPARRTAAAPPRTARPACAQAATGVHTMAHKDSTEAAAQGSKHADTTASEVHSTSTEWLAPLYAEKSCGPGYCRTMQRPAQVQQSTLRYQPWNASAAPAATTFYHHITTTKAYRKMVPKKHCAHRGQSGSHALANLKC
jgi:hypothetical protein